jgi:hypothetical protein
MTYESNINSVIEKVTLKLGKLTIDGGVIDKAMREMASTLLGSNQTRVYTKGNNTDGQQIGQYSTKSTLIGATSFRKKESVNKVFGKKKNKNLSWVTVKGNRLAVLQGGYKEIRNIDGDETAFVNLKRTGKMFKELTFDQQGKSWVIGFPANYNSKLSYNDMVNNFQKKYSNNIWGVTEKDQAICNEILQKYINA